MPNGNILCGLEVGRFMFRVGKDLEADALFASGCSRRVPRETLNRWFYFAEQYVGGLKK